MAYVSLVKSLKPSDAYMRHLIEVPLLVTTPYHHFAPEKNIQGNFDKTQQFSCKEMDLSMSHTKWWPFGLGLNVLKWLTDPHWST